LFEECPVKTSRTPRANSPKFLTLNIFLSSVLTQSTPARAAPGTDLIFYIYNSGCMSICGGLMQIRIPAPISIKFLHPYTDQSKEDFGEVLTLAPYHPCAWGA